MQKMSTTTLVFFIISAATFAILLLLAVALFLKNRSSASKLGDQEGQGIPAKRPYSCDAELAVLQDTIQITNLEEKPMRLEATSSDQGVELVSSDQWVQKFSDGVNIYKIFASSRDEQFEEVALEVKVTTAELSVRPVIKLDTLQIMIWKLKPVLLSGSNHLVERQVFNGRLQKTLNLDRANGKYYRIRVLSSDSLRNNKIGIESKSNIGRASGDTHQLLTVRVEPNRVQASNVSCRPMVVSIDQANAQSVLKRKLAEEETQDMPMNGTFSFCIHPGKLEAAKDLLRIQLTEQTILIEPHSTFGTVPLICDVRSAVKPEAADCLGLETASFSQIIAGEVMSQLQLPRKSNTYVLIFHMKMGPNSEAETSYTLQ